MSQNGKLFPEHAEWVVLRHGFDTDSKRSNQEKALLELDPIFSHGRVIDFWLWLHREKFSVTITPQIRYLTCTPTLVSLTQSLPKITLMFMKLFFLNLFLCGKNSARLLPRCGDLPLRKKKLQTHIIDLLLLTKNSGWVMQLKTNTSKPVVLLKNNTSRQEKFPQCASTLDMLRQVSS